MLLYQIRALLLLAYDPSDALLRKIKLGGELPDGGALAMLIHDQTVAPLQVFAYAAALSPGLFAVILTGYVYVLTVDIMLDHPNDFLG